MSLDRIERMLEIISFSWLPLLKGAVYYTIPLAIVSFLLGISFAFFVALASLSSNRVIYTASRSYIWAIRCTPVLVQLFIIFYGLPNLGIVLDPFVSVMISLTVSEAAYCSEIIRASIQSVAAGQWKASYALGMSYGQTLRKVILPQAIRVCIPSFGNQFISLFKTTSLAALVTIPDLFGAARLIAASTFEPMLLYLVAGAYYLILCSLLNIAQSRIEKNFVYIKAH
ncbi:amino acid ABC transporter permease [Paenibacillus rigui]|uniref:Cysteine ABC transporter permease n=1 Tax=Paenibacillus rigui TaxID=554312 RepID=A0A229UXX9_9BACL|nr:amino acid ABC transporter permease [Paenibacillus rigui]OXM88352.1 cysteine ABC transporter permease [Paenibacillus rigui]